MRHLIIILMISGLFLPKSVFAQNTTVNDSIVNTIRIGNLKTKREALQKQIAAEDKKRNAAIEGVSIETLEKMNERQDSICLELRSSLTVVELELKELCAKNTAAQIAQQFSYLRQNHHQDSTIIVTPNSPTRPSKPTKSLQRNNNKDH